MIGYSIDMTPLETHLNYMILHMNRLPMKEIGDILIRSTQKTFAAGGRPGKWIANKLGTPTLGGAGSSLARNTAASAIGDNFVEVTGGMGLIYARVHQLGATITAKKSKYLKFKMGDRWVQKKSVTIPARRWLRVQDEDVNQIVAFLKNHVLRN